MGVTCGWFLFTAMIVGMKYTRYDDEHQHENDRRIHENLRKLSSPLSRIGRSIAKAIPVAIWVA